MDKGLGGELMKYNAFFIPHELNQRKKTVRQRKQRRGKQSDYISYSEYYHG